MTADALSAPLGRDKQSKRRFELVISMPQLVLGGVGLFVVAVGAWAVIEHRPLIARLLTPAPVDGSSAQAGKKTESPSLVARPEAPTVAPFQPESTPGGAGAVLGSTDENHHHHRRQQRQAPGDCHSGNSGEKHRVERAC